MLRPRAEPAGDGRRAGLHDHEQVGDQRGRQAGQQLERGRQAAFQGDRPGALGQTLVDQVQAAPAAGLPGQRRDQQPVEQHARAAGQRGLPAAREHRRRPRRQERVQRDLARHACGLPDATRREADAVRQAVARLVDRARQVAQAAGHAARELGLARTRQPEELDQQRVAPQSCAHTACFTASSTSGSGRSESISTVRACGVRSRWRARPRACARPRPGPCPWSAACPSPA